MKKLFQKTEKETREDKMETVYENEITRTFRAKSGPNLLTLVVSQGLSLNITSGKDCMVIRTIHLMVS